MTYRPWLVAAMVLGLAHALVSLLWVCGSTWLLDTVGGPIEDWGRDGGLSVRLALLVVVGAKVAAVALLWAATTRPTRLSRVLAWLAGGVLTLYGGVLTVAGLVVTAGSLDQAADPYAIRWHAFFWDPWFLLWGACTVMAMWATRRRPGAPRV